MQQSSPTSAAMKQRHSLFFKLAFIFIASGLLLVALVSYGLREAVEGRGEDLLLQKNVNHYIDYLLKDITQGDPQEAIPRHEDATGLKFRIEHMATGEVIAGSELPAIRDLETWKQPWTGLQVGRDGKWRFGIVERPPYRFAAFSKQNFSFVVYEGAAITVIVGVVILLALTYYTVRRVLQPIKDLQAGVERVSSGEFEGEVESRGRDELAALASSFNQMTEQIRAMIEAKEQLLLDVSHELRSPLTRINLQLELAGNSKEPNLSSIKEDVRELEGLVAVILDTARLQRGKVPFTMAAIDLIKVISDLAEHRYKISLDPDSVGEALIEGDQSWLQRLLQNIFDNAQKYGDSGPIEVKVTKSALGFAVSIRDHGPGVPNDQLEAIFDSFVRVDLSRTKSTGGIGLGLGLCRRIAEAHGGSISAQNAPGGGLCVTIQLPA